jgi:3,5-epimerase/4-reductase
MATVLLYGGRGWIGSQLSTLLSNDYRVSLSYTSDVRVDDVDAVCQEMDRVQPTHVICCIGRTHGVYDGKVIPTIDYLEKPGKLRDNVRDNLAAPITLAHLCQQRNIHMTYLGTGCIFEYDDIHDERLGFKESDAPNFFGSSYSIVKGYTDQLMRLFPVLNVRIRMPITAESNPRDFITKIVGYERICSVANSMTVLDELLPLMVDMSLTKRTGTINLVNPGTITHEEVLTLYREYVDPDKTWKTMTYEEQNQLLASKRSNNMLDTSLLESWYPVTDIYTAVKKALQKRGNKQC